MLMRWTLGLVVLFALLALLARLLQFALSLALLVVLGLAVAGAAMLALRSGARRRDGRP